jgi:hypothetical protein
MAIPDYEGLLLRRTWDSQPGTRNQLPGAEPRRINDNINLLGSFDLKNFCNGFAAARGGFPVHVLDAVAGRVLAVVLELERRSGAMSELTPELAASLSVAGLVGVAGKLFSPRQQVRDPNNIFLPIFPLVFASSVFTSTETMPDWLQSFAEVQPITRAANTVRALTQGGPLATALTWTVVWCIAALAVFAPLAVRRYRAG